METLRVYRTPILTLDPDAKAGGGMVEVVKAADAQATIAALQAQCELWKERAEAHEEDHLIINSLNEQVSYLKSELNAACLEIGARDAQLTQRTVELEAAKRKVDLAEKKAWLAAHDVGFFSMWNGTDHSGPPKLALLCNDTFAWATADAEDVLDAQIDTIVELFKSEGEAGVIKWIAQQRNMKPMESVGKWLFGCDAIKKERDDLQAELERVRALIKALPKVEGEIVVNGRTIDEQYPTLSWQIASTGMDEFTNAIAALLKHRQGMEG